MVLVARGRLALILCPILCAGLEACGSGSGRSAAAVVAGPAPARAAAARDPGLAAVRAALEEGHGDLALALLAGRPVSSQHGFEPECLRARAQLLAGTPVEALSTLERARSLDAENPELSATEAEILATLDRVQAAADVLVEGMRRAGAVPVLLRAQGVIELRNQGHGEQALAALERAHELDPELPFTRWPLAQAHLLVGRARLEKAPAEATFHARAARALWPDLDDALELEAEGLAGELHFEEALALYADLETRGRRYGETPAILHQRCATRCLLEHDRTRAIEHYLAARALGMDDQGLGFGASILAEEARLAQERGLAAAEALDWAKAQVEFARALELAPGDLEAGNHLAVARFQNADYRGAAEAWERVLARALEAKLELPDPVPLNLAKAWRLAGDRSRARKVLSELLDRDPEGEWSAQARELLLVLEAEELAGK